MSAVTGKRIEPGDIQTAPVAIQVAQRPAGTIPKKVDIKSLSWNAEKADALMDAMKEQSIAKGPLASNYRVIQKSKTPVIRRQPKTQASTIERRRAIPIDTPDERLEKAVTWVREKRSSIETQVEIVKSRRQLALGLDKKYRERLTAESRAVGDLSLLQYFDEALEETIVGDSPIRPSISSEPSIKLDTAIFKEQSKVDDRPIRAPGVVIRPRILAKATEDDYEDDYIDETQEQPIVSTLKLYSHNKRKEQSIQKPQAVDSRNSDIDMKRKKLLEEQKRKWSLIGKSKEEDAIKAKLKLEQNKAAIAARQRQLASVPIPSTLLAPGRQMKKKTKLKRFDEFGDEIIGDNDDKRDQDDEDVAAVAVSVEMSMAPLLWALQGDQALPKMIETEPSVPTISRLANVHSRITQGYAPYSDDLLDIVNISPAVSPGRDKTSSVSMSVFTPTKSRYGASKSAAMIKSTSLSKKKQSKDVLQPQSHKIIATTVGRSPTAKKSREKLLKARTVSELARPKHSVDDISHPSKQKSTGSQLQQKSAYTKTETHKSNRTTVPPVGSNDLTDLLNSTNDDSELFSSFKDQATAVLTKFSSPVRVTDYQATEAEQTRKASLLDVQMRVTQNFDATKTVIGQVEKMQTFLKEMNSKLIEEGGVSDSWDEGYVSSAGNHYDDDIDNYDDAAADEYVEILKQREKLDGVEDKVIEFPSVEIISKLEKELLLEMNYTARGASSSSSSSPLSPGGLYTGAAISSNTSSPQRELYTLTAYGSHDKIDDLVTDLTDKTLVVLTTNKSPIAFSPSICEDVQLAGPRRDDNIYSEAPVEVGKLTEDKPKDKEERGRKKSILSDAKERGEKVEEVIEEKDDDDEEDDDDASRVKSNVFESALLPTSSSYELDLLRDKQDILRSYGSILSKSQIKSSHAPLQEIQAIPKLSSTNFNSGSITRNTDAARSSKGVSRSTPSSSSKSKENEHKKLYTPNIRNIGNLAGLLTGVNYNVFGENSNILEDDLGSSSESDDGEDDTRIVSIYAKAMYAASQEKAAGSRHDMLEAMRQAAILESKMDESISILAEEKAKETNEVKENTTQISVDNDMDEYYITKPVSTETSFDLIDIIATTEDVKDAMEEAERTKTVFMSFRASYDKDSKGTERFTPAEMRSRLLVELRRQEDIFNYAIELAELEKTYTIHSANEVVTAVMKKAEETVIEQQRTQENILQQQAYELAIASAMASAQAALEKEASACSKTVDELKFQLQQQGLYSEYMHHFMQAAGASSNPDKATSAIPRFDEASSVHDTESLEKGIISVNISSLASIDDGFLKHGEEVLKSLDDAIQDLQMNSIERNNESIEIYNAFKIRLTNQVSDQVLVLRNKLSALQQRKRQKLDIVRSNQELLKTAKYLNDPVMSKSMKETLLRTLQEAEDEYESNRLELEKLRWMMTNDSFGELRRFYDIQTVVQAKKESEAKERDEKEYAHDEYSQSFESISRSKLSDKSLQTSRRAEDTGDIEEVIEEGMSRLGESFGSVYSVRTEVTNKAYELSASAAEEIEDSSIYEPVEDISQSRSTSIEEDIESLKSKNDEEAAVEVDEQTMTSVSDDDNLYKSSFEDISSSRIITTKDRPESVETVSSNRSEDAYPTPPPYTQQPTSPTPTSNYFQNEETEADAAEDCVISIEEVSTTTINLKRREQVAGWVDALKEPLDTELRVLESEEDLAEDSFGSLDVQLFDQNTPGKAASGHVKLFISCVSIQSLARGYLARKHVRLLRIQRLTTREEIRFGTVSGSLSEIVDATWSKQADLYEDSFASSVDELLDDDEDKATIAELQQAVSTYQEVKRVAEQEHQQMDEEQQITPEEEEFAVDKSMEYADDELDDNDKLFDEEEQEAEAAEEKQDMREDTKMLSPASLVAPQSSSFVAPSNFIHTSSPSRSHAPLANALTDERLHDDNGEEMNKKWEEKSDEEQEEIISFTESIDEAFSSVDDDELLAEAQPVLQSPSLTSPKAVPLPIVNVSVSEIEKEHEDYSTDFDSKDFDDSNLSNAVEVQPEGQAQIVMNKSDSQLAHTDDTFMISISESRELRASSDSGYDYATSALRPTLGVATNDIALEERNYDDGIDSLIESVDDFSSDQSDTASIKLNAQEVEDSLATMGISMTELPGELSVDRYDVVIEPIQVRQMLVVSPAKLETAEEAEDNTDVLYDQFEDDIEELLSEESDDIKDSKHLMVDEATSSSLDVSISMSEAISGELSLSQMNAVVNAFAPASSPASIEPSNSPDGNRLTSLAGMPTLAKPKFIPTDTTSISLPEFDNDEYESDLYEFDQPIHDVSTASPLISSNTTITRSRSSSSNTLLVHWDEYIKDVSEQLLDSQNLGNAIRALRESSVVSSDFVSFDRVKLLIERGALLPQCTADSFEFSNDLQKSAQQQAEAVCERINDILQEMHDNRSKMDGKTLSFSQRLLAETLTTDPEVLKSVVMNKLNSEQNMAAEVALGRKDVLELAMNVDFIAGGFQHEMQSMMEEYCSEIADAMLATCVEDITREL